MIKTGWLNIYTTLVDVYFFIWIQISPKTNWISILSQKQWLGETPGVSPFPFTPYLSGYTCIHPQHTCASTPGCLVVVDMELCVDGLCCRVVLCRGVLFSRRHRLTWWFYFLQKLSYSSLMAVQLCASMFCSWGSVEECWNFSLKKVYWDSEIRLLNLY